MRPRTPANSAGPHTRSGRRLAREFVLRAAAVDWGHPSPRAYRQYSHRYPAMIGTAHGRTDRCLVFVDTKIAQGMVPAMAAARPLSTARTRTGTRTQSTRTAATCCLNGVGAA